MKRKVWKRKTPAKAKAAIPAPRRKGHKCAACDEHHQRVRHQLRAAAQYQVILSDQPPTP